MPAIFSKRFVVDGGCVIRTRSVKVASKTIIKTRAFHFFDFDMEDLDYDSDSELQEAFAAGIIKPGLNTAVPVKPKKPKINNIQGKLN